MPTCQIVPSRSPRATRPTAPTRPIGSPGAGWSCARSWSEPAGSSPASGQRRRARRRPRAARYRARLGRYYAALLRSLGFPTTLRIQDWDHYDIYEDDTRATTGLVAWGADYLAASNFIEPLFGCASGAQNIYRLCDDTLDRQIARALAAPQTDVAAWAAADRRVVDLAPAVPLTTRRSAVLVSERVGNVRTHQQLFTLLDQMWVR